MAETVKVTFRNPEDEDETIEQEVPAMFKVCHDCEGHGSVMNASMRNHAYSMEEFYETFSDEEDREHYFKRGGMYDVCCPTCGGKRVVLVPNWEQIKNPELQKTVEDYTSWEYDCQEEDARMRRWENGEY